MTFVKCNLMLILSVKESLVTKIVYSSYFSCTSSLPNRSSQDGEAAVFTPSATPRLLVSPDYGGARCKPHLRMRDFDLSCVCVVNATESEASATEYPRGLFCPHLETGKLGQLHVASYRTTKIANISVELEANRPQK